jgi:23S rRNA pseudouridine1911/1915/1917 synthase
VPIAFLHEDNHCIVVDKPAGLLTQPDRTGDPTVLDGVAAEVRRRHHKTGNVFLAVAHRLDRPVSGALLVARTSKAASRLTEQFRTGRVEKTYLAIVEKPPAAAAGTLEHYLVKDHATNRVRVARAGEPDARLARLHYHCRQSSGGPTLLEVRLDTGRAHQIRVQLAAIGCVIVGDLRYGASRGLGERIALHSHRLAFDHPTRPERIVVEAPQPEDWADWLAS